MMANVSQHNVNSVKQVLDKVPIEDGPSAAPGGFTHRVPGQHVWHGVLFNAYTPTETLEEIENFEIMDDDCIVSGYPKSGTTWLQEIVYLIYNNGDVSLCNENPNYMRIPLLEDRRSIDLCRKQPSPRVFKSHLRFRHLPKQLVHRKAAKIIHITRNPKDLMVSYFFFYQSLAELGTFTGKWQEFLSMFNSGQVVSGSWFDYINDWWQQRNDKHVLFLQYEELLRNPLREIRRIADFCGKILHSDTISKIIEHTNFDFMKNNPMTNFSTARNVNQDISPFMRKGKIGDWKNYFTVAQNEEFDQLYRRNMGGVLWTWTYE